MATEFAAKVIESVQNDPVAYASFMAHWRIGMGRHLIARYFFGASLFEDPTTEAADRGILESMFSLHHPFTTNHTPVAIIIILATR